MYTVKIKFEEKGLEPVTLENIEPGQTLLELALKNDIELVDNKLIDISSNDAATTKKSNLFQFYEK